jgi:uncharacterized protein YecE (DUF72 family)
MIRIGTAGWDYPDWAGTVYPKPKPKGFDPLEYLSGYFSTIEINSTFYRPAAVKVARTWVQRVSGRDFKFTAKLWKRFTHERAETWSTKEVAEARGGLDVLYEAGRLGGLLLQFPWSFRRDETNEEWLRDLAKAFRHLPLVLEVRHETWNSPEVIDWLIERQIGLVNVDQPLFRNSIKPAAVATAPVGYVRLHGRNFRDWFREKATRDERYDYLYSAAELQPWAARIKEVAAKTTEMYAVTNNHHLGKAPANGKMLEGMITGWKVRVPDALLETYQAELAPYVEG